MISANHIFVWTSRGWTKPSDLYIGDKIISFNPDRNCSEYDEVYSIKQEWRELMGLGIYHKSMRQLLTPDHPILVWHEKKKELQRPSIESRFMGAIAGNTSVIYNSMFEPFYRSQDLEDIRWSARMAATYSMYDRPVDIWNIISDLGGYEAQVWLDTFYHWNSLMPAFKWQYAVRLPSLWVRDIIFHVASRAGLGCYWAPPKTVKHSVMYLSTSNNIYTRASAGWVMIPTNLLFNISSKNGNALVKTDRGNFIVACDYKEKN